MFFVSCGLFSREDSKSNPANTEDPQFTGSVSIACQNSQRCKTWCDNLFLTDQLLNKCLNQTTDDVSHLHSVLSAMEKGNWKSIKPEHLSTVIKFDDDLWPKYASVNNRALAQTMLLWIAEESEVAEFLVGDQKVLKNAFQVLGTPGAEDKLVLKGLRKDVDLENDQTFFEVSAHKKNDNGFKAVHALLKEECKEQKSCVKRVYCEIDQTVVFGKLNRLGLGGDADADGDSLHQDECKN